MKVATESPRFWHHFNSAEHQRDALVLGMWMFLATEFVLFGAVFTGYTMLRLLYPESFEAGSRHLNLLIGASNTVILLTSSLTMALAVRAGHLGQQKKLVRCLLLTALLGSAFLGLKVVEYYLDYLEKLVPGLAFDPTQWQHGDVQPGAVQLFLMLYYVLTGLHAVHMTFGITVILILAVLAQRGYYPPGYDGPVEAWGLYWHFVDIVWIFLLPLLYLIGTRAEWY